MKAPKWNDRLEQQRKAKAINEVAYLTKIPKRVVEKEWADEEYTLEQEMEKAKPPSDWKHITYYTPRCATLGVDHLTVFNRQLTKEEIDQLSQQTTNPMWEFTSVKRSDSEWLDTVEMIKQL